MTEHVARPLVIDNLATEFARVAEREARRRPRRTLRAAVVAFAALALVAATAYAAGLLPVGEPLDGPPRGDIPARFLPKPGTVRIDSVRVSDPDGGPSWGLRLATTTAGASCFAFGRVQQGQFGLVDAQGTFRPLPAAGTATCGDLGIDPVVFDVRRVGGGGPGARTLVGGLASRAVVRLTIADGKRSVEMAPTRAGGFLAVFRGRLPLSDLRLVAEFTDDTKRALLGGSARGG